MKIKILPPSGPELFLAGLATDPLRSQASQVRVNGRRVVQENGRLRAAAMQHFDRGNLKHTITFEVSRIHPSLIAAEAFILDHPSQMPGSGTVTFIAQGPNNTLITRVLPQAVIPTVQCLYTGITTTHSYTIHGGAFQ